MNNIAIISISKRGITLAKIIHASMESSDIYVPEKYTSKGNGIPYRDPLKDLLADIFIRYKGFVLIMPAGAAVRLLAPLLNSKYYDPAVITVDEAGKYSVSLLSGHIGGANKLAEEVASIIQAQPIITSASDILNTLTVDTLGREHGWIIENPSALKAVSSAIVNELPVGVFQEAGEKDWWPGDKPFPRNVTIYGSMESLVSSGCSSALIITDRVFDVDVIEGIESIIYRPKSLAIGLGCHKGVTLKAVEEAITLTLNTAGLTSTSLRVLATIESRKDEQGLLSFSLKHNIPLVIFNRSELSSMIQIPTPSPRVFKHMGIYGVSEPAALLASNNGVILSGKNIFNSVTVAIARDQFAR